jgi:hypothetical protein
MIGAFSIVLLGNPILELINSQTGILKTNSIIILAFYLLIFNFQSVSTNFIIMDNRYPMLAAYLITGFTTIISEIIFINFIPELGINSILLAQIIVLLAYNAWKWPAEVAKSQSKSLNQFIWDVITSYRMKINKKGERNV